MLVPNRPSIIAGQDVGLDGLIYVRRFSPDWHFASSFSTGTFFARFLWLAVVQRILQWAQTVGCARISFVTSQRFLLGSNWCLWLPAAMRSGSTKVCHFVEGTLVLVSFKGTPAGKPPFWGSPKKDTLTGRCVLFGCFARKIDGPGLPGG